MRHHSRPVRGNRWHYTRLFIVIVLAAWLGLLTLFSHPQVNATVGYGGITSTNVPQSQANSQVSTAPNVAGLDPGQFIWDGVTGLFRRLTDTAIDFFQRQIFDWASSLGFLYITPGVLTYSNPMVITSMNWSLMALNGFVTVLLVIAGYQILTYRFLDLQEQSITGSVLRIAFATIAGDLALPFFIPELIKLCNLISMSYLVTMIVSVNGDVSLPFGAVNALKNPSSWSIFILLDCIVSLLFVFTSFVRIALLDVCIMLSPWWAVLLANEYTRPWGRLGVTTFVAALLVQPLQVIVLGLGAALIANFRSINLNDPEVCSHMSEIARSTCLDRLGHASISASSTPIALAIGIATMYIAFKIPGMLFSEAVRASIGSVNRDVSQQAKSLINGVMSVVSYSRQLTK